MDIISTIMAQKIAYFSTFNGPKTTKISMNKKETASSESEAVSAQTN